MSPEQIFVIVGISLALFLSILLLSSKLYKCESNRILAAILLSLSLILYRVGEIADGGLLIEILEYIRIEYLPPALLYFYVSSRLGGWPRRNAMILWFIPFVFFSLLSTFLLILDSFDYAYLEYVEPLELYFPLALSLVGILRGY